MPLYTVETTYRLPVYRQRTYRTDTPEAACVRALADEDWGDAKEDVETAGETYVTGIWRGRAAYSNEEFPVPDKFEETIQRKAEMFATLVALLKEPAQKMGLSQHDFADWLPRATAAIARADAISSNATEGE